MPTGNSATRKSPPALAVVARLRPVEGLAHLDDCICVTAIAPPLVGYRTTGEITAKSLRHSRCA